MQGSKNEWGKEKGKILNIKALGREKKTTEIQKR